MVFGLFNKKRPLQSIIPPEKNIGLVQNNLKISFSRIRDDVRVIREWISFFKTKESDQDEKLNRLDQRINEIGEVLSYMQLSMARLYDEKTASTNSKEVALQSEKQLMVAAETPKIGEKEQKKTNHTFLEGLTETQRVIFFRLGTLMKEANQSWVPLKVLARELYPERDYTRVRSTVSMYVDVLSEYNLVQKKRSGKQTSVSLTEKGQSFFKTQQTKLKKKVVKKGK